MAALGPSPPRMPPPLVQRAEGPVGGAVAVRVAPAPHCRVAVMSDLDCWALLLLVQGGREGAGVSAPRGLRRWRQHSPWNPPSLAAAAVAPCCTRHQPSFGVAPVSSSVGQNACDRGADVLCEDLPSRGDD